MSTVQEVAKGPPSILQKNALKMINDMIFTFAIAGLQLSYLPNVNWPKQEEYTPVSLNREFNQRRLDEMFTKES
jgi:hypothetical protein